MRDKLFHVTNEKHFLETVMWGVIPIVNFNGVLVEKIIGGYHVLNQKCKNTDEVDEVIRLAQKSLSDSIERGKTVSVDAGSGNNVAFNSLEVGE